MRAPEDALKKQLSSRAWLSSLALLGSVLGCADESAPPPTATSDSGSALDAALEQPLLDANTLDADAHALDAGAHAFAADTALDRETVAHDAAKSDGALDLSAVDEVLQQQIAELEGAEPPLRGLSAVVVHADHGVVYQRAFGAFSAERVFLLGSASMLLSSGVLLRLADRGLVDLDAPLSQALGSWGQHKTGVTVAQLLSNSAGLPSLDALRAAEESPATYPELVTHLCQRRVAGTLAACGRAIYEDDAAATNRPPDTVYAQGGSAWQLAGALAEQVANKPWSQLLRETYEPCGVRSLGYTNEYERGEPLAHPAHYDGDPRALAPTDNPSIEGGGYATALDYAKVLLLHLRGGSCGSERVLSEAAVARMRVNRIKSWGGTTGSPVSPGFGLGWTVSDRSGVLSAPSVFGFYPLLDPRRRYALVVAIELDVVLAAQVVFSLKPVLDRMFPPSEG